MSALGPVSVFISGVGDAIVLSIIALVSEASLRLDAVSSDSRCISADAVGGFEIVRESFSGDVTVLS